MVSDATLTKYCNLFLHNNSLYITHTGKIWLTQKSEITQELMKKHLNSECFIVKNEKKSCEKGSIWE